VDDRPGGGRLALVTIAGVVVAAVCALVGHLYAAPTAFFGERNSPGERAFGFAVLLAASVSFVAGPLYEAWARKTVGLAAGAALFAGVVFAGACLLVT
jgi:hypothetical protein